MKPTPELKLARKNWVDALEAIIDGAYDCDMDDIEALRKDAQRAKHFEQTCNVLVMELQQKNGVSP